MKSDAEIREDVSRELSWDPQVRDPAAIGVDDSDAQAIAHVPDWNTQVPAGRVTARVQARWVTLDGEADFDYQRHEIERVVRHFRGVVGITSNVTVAPPVSPDRVEAEIEEAFIREAEIEEAFIREAEIDARHVRVEVSDHTAELYGPSTR
jgi:osmotically-inducible protein OsmY